MGRTAKLAPFGRLWRGPELRAAVTVVFAVVAIAIVLKAAERTTPGGIVYAGPSGSTPDLASDAFNRVVNGGWASADLGGAYELDGRAADFNVSNGFGTMLMSDPGATRATVLTDLTTRDIDVRFRVVSDKLVAGGNCFVYVVARRTANNEYRPRLILGPNGSISVHASVVVDGIERPLGSPVVVPALTQSAGKVMWLRAAITGVSPTTIRVKAWADGQSEPAAWAFTNTDAEPSVQGVGGLGVAAYLGAKVSNAPVSLGFDDLLVMATQ